MGLVMVFLQESHRMITIFQIFPSKKEWQSVCNQLPFTTMKDTTKIHINLGHKDGNLSAILILHFPSEASEVDLDLALANI